MPTVPTKLGREGNERVLHRRGWRTGLQQRRVREDGGDGAHALVYDGVPDRVPRVGAPHCIPHHRVHVLAGRLVARAQQRQRFQQLYLRPSRR